MLLGPKNPWNWIYLLLLYTNAEKNKHLKTYRRPYSNVLKSKSNSAFFKQNLHNIIYNEI